MKTNRVQERWLVGRLTLVSGHKHLNARGKNMKGFDLGSKDCVGLDKPTILRPHDT
jgi:hypothetical protein